MNIVRVSGIVTLWIVTIMSISAFAQNDSVVPDRLLVGTVVVPPFAMKTTDGQLEGLAIELWQAVAQDLGVAFELREYSLGQILEAVEKGDLDAIIVSVVTEQREIIMDYSQPFLTSGSAIAVSADPPGHSWLQIAKRLLLLNFLPIIGLLLLLSLAAGAIVWLFESRHNREMFGGGILKGLSQGIWWAVVTMTTVGYGDKAPKTSGGRLVAIIWMFASIILIASFTAAITSSLTVGELRSKVSGLRDLPGVRVGSVAQSESLKFLARRGIAVRPFENVQVGLQAIVDKKIDAFVYNESTLQYFVRTEFPGRVHVLAGIFNHYYVSIGMPTGSPLREPINRALLKIIARDEWLRLVERYIGHGH
jgi:polar amino acid transport system substrate-binding protein